MTSPPPPSPHLRLFSDNTTLAIFPATAVLLSPAGSCCLVVGAPPSSPTKYLTRFVPLSVKARVVAALQFRNAHFDSSRFRAYTCAEFYAEHVPLSVALTHARWPEKSPAARVVVEAADGYAAVDRTGHELTGHLLLPEAHPVDKKRVNHVWVSRTFSRLQVPSEFAWPLSPTGDREGGARQAYVLSELPSPRWWDADEIEYEFASGFVAMVQQWLVLPSLPQAMPRSFHVHVMVESDSVCTSRVLANGSVEAIFKLDGSSLLLQDDFFAYHGAAGEERVYAKHALPRVSAARDDIPLQDVGARLETLREGSSASARPAPQPLPLPSHDRLTLVECRVVPDVGRFSAFSSGLVTAVFADRTSLHVEPGTQMAQVLSPDGASACVSFDRPMGLDAYIRPVVEFQRFVSQSPAERAQARLSRQLNRERVDEHVGNVNRLIKLTGWSLASGT
jgi:hypothetical protein